MLTPGRGPWPAPSATLSAAQQPRRRGRRAQPTFSREEQQLDQTLPFLTLRQMLTRNGLAASAATTTLVPGSTGVTEVVLQLFTGGTEAYLHGTVINGGHTGRHRPRSATHRLPTTSAPPTPSSTSGRTTPGSRPDFPGPVI
jgi:hypothetical protein